MVTEVGTIGFFDRIKNAFIGVLVGIVLFFGSFVVLYVNEGLQKFAKVIEDAAVLEAGQTSADGVITHTDTATAASPVLGDEYITGGEFLALQRRAEVFAWEEVQSTTTEDNLGGSQTETTDYSYEKQWVSSAPNTRDFKDPGGRENIQKTITDLDEIAEGVLIGDYPLHSENTLHLHNYAPLELGRVSVQSGEVVEGTVLFLSRNGTTGPLDPTVGDQRIMYKAVPLDDEMTFVGTLDRGELRRHGETNAFDLFAGDRDAAYRQARSEDTFRTWMLRLLGFGMMAFGLFLIVNPFVIFLSVIPIFGAAGKFVAFLASVLIALVMSTVTIIVSIIAHNPIALLIVILAAISGSIYFFKKKRRN